MVQENMLDNVIRSHLVELLKGGFAPVVALLREFQYGKTGIILEGLPFSVWSLLEHMKHRQSVLLQFMRNPDKNYEVWPEAYWPESTAPEDEQQWNASISRFEGDLDEMISIVINPDRNLFEVHENGKTLVWAAMTTFHHNAYTIGQIKSIGRQLGVW